MHHFHRQGRRGALGMLALIADHDLLARIPLQRWLQVGERYRPILQADLVRRRNQKLQDLR